jgi:hypothetical protein
MKEKNSLAGWNVKASQFPENGKMESKLKFLVRYAILAASGLNSQPWQFKIDNKTIEIWADKSRQRPQVDPKDRELFISLGCATANLEIAAKYFGMMFEKEYAEDGSDKAVRFKFSEGKTLSGEKESFMVITKRLVNREDYNGKEIPKEILGKLEKEYGGAKLKLVVQKELKNKLAELVEKSDRIWFRSNELVDELEYWLQDDLEFSKDGLPTGVLNLYKLAIEVKYLLSRSDESIVKKSRRDKNLVEKSPVIVVISTENETKKNLIMAGELYEKLALYLTNFGIQNAFFNTVIELKNQRNKLQKMLGIKGKAQLMLRLGYSDIKAEHSSRRPLEEILR